MKKEIEYLYKSFPMDRAPNSLKYKLKRWATALDDLQSEVRADQIVECCGIGCHASKNILDGMGYTRPGYIGLVKVRGRHDVRSDKQAWEQMMPLKWAKWEPKDSLAFAAWLLTRLAPFAVKGLKETSPRHAHLAELIKAARAVARKPTWDRKLKIKAIMDAGIARAVRACAHDSVRGNILWQIRNITEELIADHDCISVSSLVSAAHEYQGQGDKHRNKAHNWIVKRFGLQIPKS